MVAMSFNSQQYSPQYGGGAGLPAGPNGEDVMYKVMIVGSQQENTTDNFGNIKGGYLAIELASIEGPTQGTKQIDRINLHHTNPKVVEIANKQLSAYCHVLNKHQFNNTEELHNIPFIVKIGKQKLKAGEDDKGYTEVKALYDINSNEPGKAGSGPQVNQQQAGAIPPAGGVQAQGGWGAAQGQGGPSPDQQQTGGWGQQSAQAQGGPTQDQAQGGWGQQQAGATPPGWAAR